MDEIGALLRSPGWWFTSVVVPLFLTALLAALARLRFMRVPPGSGADVVLACHCLAAMSLATYIAVWGNFPSASAIGWDYWHAKAGNILVFGIIPVAGVACMPLLNSNWPKRALALLYSAIALTSVAAGVLNPQPLWIMAVGYCFCLMMASTLCFLVVTFVIIFFPQLTPRREVEAS